MTLIKSTGAKLRHKATVSDGERSVLESDACKNGNQPHFAWLGAPAVRFARDIKIECTGDVRSELFQIGASAESNDISTGDEIVIENGMSGLRSTWPNRAPASHCDAVAQRTFATNLVESGVGYPLGKKH
ncbi:hypothetical protein PC116_g9071 [Phytophthora cactorum]|nr:hypothetical protein PC116_g9071 [Phytophthora cactorum]